MRIAVIGANGRLGRIFVETALRAGHSVRAGIKGGGGLAPHPRLEVVVCDATKPGDLRVLLRNQEVVMSAIGHVKNSSPDVQTRATEATVLIMNELGITRFVDITGTGVRFPGDVVTIVDRILNLAVQLMDPSRVKDGRDHQEVLKESSIEWTTLRVLKLQDVAARPYTLTLHGPTKWYVGRQEAANALLQVIDEKSFVRQSPIISRAARY